MAESIKLENTNPTITKERSVGINEIPTEGTASPVPEVKVINPKKKVKSDTAKQLLRKLIGKYRAINSKEPDKYTGEILNALNNVVLMQKKREWMKKLK